MSCSDTKKSKKRKNCKSGNMGDVLGKECGDSENDELQVESCEESVREEADGAPSVDEQCPPDNSEEGGGETKVILESKDIVIQKKLEVPVIPVKEEKPCNCDACKDRRELAAEQVEEIRRLQSYWMELRQYIRMVYRMAMEGSEVDTTVENEMKMKELVQKLCSRDPHQLFQRLESQIQEFVIEAKVRQLELLHREEQTPEVAQIFLRGLLEGFEKLCRGAKQLEPLLQQLQTEHLQRFNLTWEVFNKHLYQSCVYTDPLVQTNLPHYIGKLRNAMLGESDVYTDLVHKYLAFDDEMTLIGAMWRDAETLIHEYNQEQATLKAKQRMLREDWELFKAQRKLIQQKMWSKTASELREFDEQLLSLAALAGSPESPPDGTSPEEGCSVSTSAVSAAAVPTAMGASCSAVNMGAGFCLGCSTRRSCPCEECVMSHLLTCGALITPTPEASSTVLQNPLYSHKADSTQEYRAEGEGSEQPPESPAEPTNNGESNENVESDVVELPNTQTQSCECHVCTAPLMSAMDLMESYECHTCVQQAMPPPGSVNSPGVNVNLHTGGFHLYPHIHGTGGGGDAGSLYPHLYNVHPSLLSQLGTKHSRLGIHLQDQVPVVSIDPKSQHIQSPVVSSVADLLPPGLSLEALPPLSNTDLSISSNESSAVIFPTPTPVRLKTVANSNVLTSASTGTTVPVSSCAAAPPVPSVKMNGTGGLVQQHKVKASGACQDNHPGGTSGSNSSINSNSSNSVNKSCVVSEKHMQSSTSTQTSPNKALAQQKVLPTSSATTKTQSQSVVKRGSTGSQSVVNGHHHPIGSGRSNVSSVRHSMTQTANTGTTHSHVNSSLPDVVRSAASSTTSHRSVSGSAGKVIGHSCHKNVKNGNAEPIKRVSCTDYADGEVVDAEDSSSQDDTCSERSSSTTTSTQRDSRHCDCCYCEVFGHGVPSVAPVSRNYQEMRERLRLLLTKKKAKCKMGANNSTASSSSSGNNQSQPVVNASNAVPEVATKPVVPATSAASMTSVPTQATPLIPLLSTQNSADSSVSQPSKDPRDLEALLDFIEGNQSGRCKNLKKAAKKARQKQRKLEEKERREQEEAERLRGLAALQNNAPEVTITVVNTPGTPLDAVGPTSSLSSSSSSGKQSSNNSVRSGKGSKGTESQTMQVPVSNGPSIASTNKASNAPQMVTIKRVMEPNGAEPTVTITLKGATPDKDKVLFTLVNGQVCQSQDDGKVANQSNTDNMKGNGSNPSANGKKKKNKGNNINSNNNSSQSITNPPSKTKSQQNTAKNNSKTSNGKSSGGKQSQTTVINSTLVDKTANCVPPISQLKGSVASTQLNGITSSKGPSSVAALRSKIETSTNNSRSFSLENLKLPPGITITKVDGPAAAAAAQRRAQLKAQDNPKPPASLASPASSTTIIAAPTSIGNPARIAGFGQAVNGSNVIVVDTGRMKDDLEGNVANTKETVEDASQNQGGNGKKKKKKNKNNGNNESEALFGKQQLQSNGKQSATNGKNNQRNGNISSASKSQQNLLPYQAKQNANSKNNNPLSQPAIIKVNGSMVTIRNSALQQAMSAAAPRLSQHVNGQPEVQLNGEVVGKNSGIKGNKKGASNPVVNGTTTKGKENNGVRFTNSDGSTRGRGNQGDCNGISGSMHSGKIGSNPRVEENLTMRGGNMNSSLSQRSHPLQQQIPTLNQKVMQNHTQETNLQHSNNRAVMQAQSAVREAMAAATEAKKKKKKKKGAGGQGHADDWNLVESVFAPKDIDLENGDIDDDERELEAFKRFCFNSVPPKRKEKVHLNIKDIVLKKKSSAIGCS